MDKKKERVVIFIDGSNFYRSSKKLNVVEKINFQKLINELVRDRALAKVFLTKFYPKLLIKNIMALYCPKTI